MITYEKLIINGRHPFYTEYKNVCKFGLAVYEIPTSFGVQKIKGQQVEILYYASLDTNPIAWKQFHQSANGLIKRELIIKAGDEISLSQKGKELFDIMSKVGKLFPV